MCRLALLAHSFALLCAGCALRPAGEDAERARIDAAGTPYEQRAETPALPETPALEDYLRVAFFSNAELEARYHAWRAAIEQVPQDASFPNASVSFSYLFSGGAMKAWDRTTLGIANEPMTTIPFPTKLSTAGRRALEDARAAGLRFESAKFVLQEKVLGAYYDLALLGESLRLQEERVSLTDSLARLAHVRIAAGKARIEESLAAQTELDLERNELENLKARLTPTAAAMNALLGRPSDALVPLPAALPTARTLLSTDAELLAFGAERNKELAALASDVAGRKEALDLARQAYLPDFSLSASFTGSASQTLGGMLTLPLRLEAIKASIAQARANLGAVQAARTQYARDLAATFVLQLATLRNDERQIELFEHTIIPRAQQAVEAARASYAAGRGAFAELIETQRTQNDARATAARVRIEREKALAAIESAAAVDIETLGAR